MIEKDFLGDYVLSCDCCGEEVMQDSFEECVEYKKDKSNGWISRKVNGSWEDICPECKGENK